MSAPEDMTEKSQKAARMAAFIIYRPAESELRVAGISLLDRQLIALHRAGCHPLTVITAKSVPSPLRTQQLKIPFQIAASLPSEAQPCLVLDGNAYVEQPDISALLRDSVSIQSKDGSPVAIQKLDSPSHWSPSAESTSQAFKSKYRARNLNSDEESAALSTQLLKGTISSSDGLVDRFFNRPISRQITKRLLETSVSPNLISLGAIFIGLLAGLMLAIPRQEFAVLGAILFQFSAILDCSDGDIARLHFKESLLGKWLDIVGDQVVHIAIFVGIGFGLINASPSFAITLLTMSAVAGAILAFATFLWASNRAQKDPRIDRILQATANRDFSVVVLCLACIGRLDIFAWLVGIGIHIYWIGLLIISIRANKQAQA